MLSLPQEDPQKRSEAAALWQALNASPETLLQEGERLQRLQKRPANPCVRDNREPKGLLELAGKPSKRSRRYANGLVWPDCTSGSSVLLVLFWLGGGQAQDVSNWAQGLDWG
jgi:hypothetical protein